MRGELGNLSGSFFQRRAANFAGRVARRDFDLRQTSLVHHADQVGDSALKQMLDDAADDASRDFTEDDAALVEKRQTPSSWARLRTAPKSTCWLRRPSP